MAKTIVVCGYGPGISSAVAQRFGQEGFNVALVGRSHERLAAGVASLESRGVRAAAFPADLGDESQVRGMIEAVRAKLGAITALHWNVFSRAGGNLLTADTATIRQVFELPVTSLLVALQTALPDLTRERDGALLVTNGGFGLNDPNVNARVVAFEVMGLAVANAAKHKLVGVLSEQLKPMHVYVGEVMVLTTVKGTAWDNGTSKLEAATVAEAFYELFTARKEVSKSVG